MSLTAGPVRRYACLIRLAVRPAVGAWDGGTQAGCVEDRFPQPAGDQSRDRGMSVSGPTMGSRPPVSLQMDEGFAGSGHAVDIGQ